jgi:nucleoside-diphosphate-sugar epimerase
VGVRLVPRLLRANLQLRLLIRDPARAESFADRGAEIVIGDLRDPDAMRRALDETYAVVHLAAAFRNVSDAEMEDVNHRATVTLARLARARRFILVSSQLVYGPGRGRPARETDELRPAPAAYPRSKAQAEAALQVLAEEGLDLRIARLGFVYGEGDPHLEESLTWAKTWPAHRRLHMVHHADVGQAVLRALVLEGLNGSIFNVADDAPVSAFELHTLNGQESDPRLATLTLDDPWEGVMDTSHARDQLGFRPIYPSVYSARDAGAL